jgi:hypothetical protein
MKTYTFDLLSKETQAPASRKLKVLFVFATALLPLGLGAWFLIQRSQNPVQQSRPRRIGPGAQVVTLKSGANLQAAIDAAQLGDTLILEAGGVFRGTITLPKKNGDGSAFITIRTSNLAGIAKDGSRISPTQAGAMPKILGATAESAVRTAAGAHHYKFIGIEFLPAPNTTYIHNLINLGEDNYKSMDQFPHELIFDRCWVHSTGLNKVRRGFALNSGNASILNSYVSGFAGDGDETQAVAGWNGPGPFHIINNYLEAGGEILLFGGGDPSIQGLVPSDIEIRKNHFFRPTEWLGKATIKGNLEVKNARRVVIDGNLLDSEIRMTAFVLTVRNQNGTAPWSTIEDVEITNNIVRHVSTGVNILGTDNSNPSQEAKRIKVADNLFEDVVNPKDMAYFLQVSGSESVTIDHNTVQQAGNIISAYGRPARNFVFTNNILPFNNYGIACFIDGPKTCGAITYCHCFSQITLKGNVIVDNANVSASYSVSDTFPPGNFVTASFQKIGFIDYLKSDWRLQPSSPYRNRATDGRNPGVDIDALTRATANISTGVSSQ